jgi:hypothetical protein
MGVSGSAVHQVCQIISLRSFRGEFELILLSIGSQGVGRPPTHRSRLLCSAARFYPSGTPDSIFRGIAFCATPSNAEDTGLIGSRLQHHVEGLPCL